MSWDYKFFSEEEMRCHCGCGGLPDARLMEVLQGIREISRIVMPVSSGYRCPEYDKKIGGKGEHSLGLAADVLVKGKDARTLIKVALQVFDVPRIGVNQPTGMPDAPHFIHFGVATPEEGYPTGIWSYPK